MSHIEHQEVLQTAQLGWYSLITWSLSYYCQELYDTLEKHRPNLFRLASDADEKDSGGISE